MRVVVTGATGFVGRRVCVALLAAGHAVCAAVRGGAAPVADIAEHIVVGDAGPDTPWRAALRAGDAIVHLAARAHQGDDVQARQDFQRINVDGTRSLVEAAVASGASQLLFVSSAKVFGETSPHDAQGRPHAYSAADMPQPRGPYGASKLAAEVLLQERCAAAGIALTILRPPLVYGPGNKANMFALMRAIDAGWPLPFGSIDNQRSLIYVDNLADAIVHGIATAVGQRCYTVSDVELSTPGLVRALAAGLGTPARLWPCPFVALRALGRLAGRSDSVARLTDSMVLDRAQIARELGWRPRIESATAMRATGEWFRRGTAC